jgi:hypothetical protein
MKVDAKLYARDNSAETDLKFTVYGMGVDLATILAIMGTVWTGDPLSLDPSFSIGGRDTGVNNLLNNLGGLLGMNYLKWGLLTMTLTKIISR